MRLVSPSVQLSTDEIIGFIQTNEFAIVTAIRDDANDPRGLSNLCIVLMGRDTSVSNKLANFRSMILSATKSVPPNFNLLLVSFDGLSRPIERYLDTFCIEHPEIYIENISYTKFIIEVPLHESQPLEFGVANPELLATFVKKYHCDPTKFPDIMRDDAMVVWHGIKVGAIVRVKRVSETAGTSVVYRIVR